MYRAVVGSGQGISKKKRLNYYLKALRKHREPRILFEVKSKIDAMNQGKKLVELDQADEIVIWE